MPEASSSEHSQRQYSPVEAAFAVAQFVPADPAVWTRLCGVAGIKVSVDDGGLWIVWNDADPSEATFLVSWLNLTPGGKAAVIAYLDKQDRGHR